MFNSSTVHLSLLFQKWRAPAQDFLPDRLPACRDASEVWGELCYMIMLPILTEGHQHTEPDPKVD